MRAHTKSAIVVGAGLAGLSAAYYLQSANWQVKVFEASGRLGGRAQTDEVDGYLVDTGASAFTSSYGEYLQLAASLGLSAAVKNASPVVGIPRGGRIHELDIDKILLSGVTTGLFSPGDKLRLSRLLWDALGAKYRGKLNYADMSKAALLDSESVAQYAERRLSPALHQYFCDPLTRMMLIAGTDAVSKVELFSAIANIIGARLHGLQGGVNAFAQALGQKLDVRLNSPVEYVESSAEGVRIGVNGGVEQADACVMACDLDTATALCRDQQNLLKPLQQKLQYTSAITVALGFTERPKSRSTVITLPSCESPEVALLFLDHNKCSDRAPKGRFLINTHWDDLASKANMACSDEQLVARTLQIVEDYFPELAGSLEMQHVARWEKALPLTAPGSYRAIAAFNRSLNPAARVQFAADFMSAAGQNTAVSFGRRAANNLIKHLGGLSATAISATAT